MDADEARREYLKMMSPEFLPLLDYLYAQLGGDYTILVKVDDFGREVTAGVVHPTRDLAVRLRLQHGLYRRSSSLTPADLARLRAHLTSDATEDLWLDPPPS